MDAPERVGGDAEGALVIADCTRRETLRNVPLWAASIRDVCGPLPMVVLINKSDLAEHARFSWDDAAAVADGLGVPWYRVSAKSGENVENAFSTLGRILVRDTIKK